MKKLIILFSGVLFAYTITNTKTYSEKINSDTLKTDIQVIITQRRLNTLIDLIGQNVKKLNSFCQNVTYSFNPVYKNINKKEVFEYYKAYLNAECIFKTSEIKKFSSLINKLPKTKVKLTYLNFTVTDKERKTVLNSLKTKAYTDIQNEAKNFSKKLNQKCFITDVKIFTPYQNQQKIYSMKAYSLLPVPNQNKKITIKADYKIDCY